MIIFLLIMLGLGIYWITNADSYDTIYMVDNELPLDADDKEDE